MDLPQGGFGAHEKRLQENPEEIVRVVRASARGIQFIKSHKEESVQFMMEWLRLDRSVAEAVYPIVTESLADFGLPEDAVVQSAIEAAKFQARLDKEVPLNQVRDWSFAEKVRSEMLQKGTQR
jgi:ABC-type nitrate/sulfonate/bicarbonate transport system substrate-binding protein